MTEAAPLLEVSDLRIAARTGDSEHLIVDGMRLDVRPGEAIAIVGESGSGKSMTARALIGLLPTGVGASGSIRFGGEQLIGAPERRWRQLRGRSIAMLPQDPFKIGRAHV